MKIYPVGHVVRFAHSWIRVGCLAATGLGASAALQAADVSWSSAVDGDWVTASNWSSSPALPGSTDGVTIAATSGGTDPYTVTFGLGTGADASLEATVSQITLGTVAVGAPQATLHLKGGTLIANVGAAPNPTSTTPFAMANSILQVDAGATLLLRSGATGGSNGLRALSLLGDAEVVINGNVAAQPSSGTGTPGGGLYMYGSAGQVNTVTINAGATATFGYSFIGASGSAGTAQNHVIVDGGSLTVRALELGRAGSDGNSTVVVKSGGTLSVGASGASLGGGTSASGRGELIIGEAGGASQGTVTVSSVLSVGAGNQSGKGTITLHAGSFTASNNVTLGNATGTPGSMAAEGVINVHGGVFTLDTANARILTVSGLENTKGTLNITGGVVNLVRTQGDHTLRLAPSVTTGTGTATLNLSGGTLNVDKFRSETAAGTINFTGGLFTVKQATVNNGSVFTVGNGTTAATLRFVTGTGSGAHTFADGLAIAANARLEGAGTVGSLTTIRGALGATGAMSFTAGLSLLDGATIDLNGGGALAVTGGSLVIADGATINASLTSFTEGQSITLFSVAGSAPDLDGVQFTFNGVATTGSWVGDQFQITASAIPEPSAFAGFLATCALLTATFRRRRP